MDAWARFLEWLAEAGLLGAALSVTAWAARRWIAGLDLPGKMKMLESLDSRVGEIHEQVFPNGGTSLRDAVARVEGDVSAHKRESAERDSLMTARVDDVRLAQAVASAKLSLMADRIPEAMWVGDGEGNNEWTNEAFEGQFAIEGLGIDWEQVVCEDKSPGYIDRFFKALKNRHTERFSESGVWLRMADPETGRRVPAECDVECEIVRNREGEAVRTVGVIYRA